MVTRVQIIKRLFRILKRKGAVDESVKPDLLLLQKTIQRLEIELRADNDTPVRVSISLQGE